MEHSRVIEWIQATAGQRDIQNSHNSNNKGKNQNKKSANKKDGLKDIVNNEAVPVAR